MLYDYKLDKKIHTTIYGLNFFLDSFVGENVKYSYEEEELLNGMYSFTGEHRINGFYDILALNYIGAINLHIYNYNSFGNGELTTNIDLSNIDKSKLNCSLEDYLYINFNKYIDNIEQHSTMELKITYKPVFFLISIMKILFQELEIKKLPNNKILDELIKYIKSEIGGKNNYMGEIELFYDYNIYINSMYSIYPILVELDKWGYLKIKGLELKEGCILFKLERIINIDSFNTGTSNYEEMIEFFGASDSIESENKEINKKNEIINNFDYIQLPENIIYNKEKYLFKNIINGLEYSIYNHGDYDIFIDTLLQNDGKYVKNSIFIENNNMNVLNKNGDSRSLEKRITDVRNNLINNISKKMKFKKEEKKSFGTFIMVNNGFKIVHTS